MATLPAVPLLPITWLATLPPGTEALTARPATVWLKPARSNVPLLEAAPNDTLPPCGNPLFTPRRTVPALMFVPPP